MTPSERKKQERLKQEEYQRRRINDGLYSATERVIAEAVRAEMDKEENKE